MAVKTFINHEMGRCRRMYDKLVLLWQKQKPDGEGEIRGTRGQ